jgi:hypothetical protein
MLKDLFQFSGDQVNYDLLYVWVLYTLLLVLLLAPVILYLNRGWWHRRIDILNNFSPYARDLYLKHFLPDSAELVNPKPSRLGQLLARVWGQELGPFEANYDAQFGRWRYAGPTTLMFAFAGIVLLFPAAAAYAGLVGDGASGWRWVIALAILGGYIRVVFDLCTRAYQENIRPTDVLWAAYRLALSPPLGYGAAKLLDGDTVRFGPFAAFLLGLFATSTVMEWGRRVFAKLTNSPELAAGDANRLLALPALDQVTADLIRDEGITTVTQLAYADPIRMSIRTGLGFSFVTSAASEAMLAMFLDTREKMVTVRGFGVCGAYEAVGLWNRYASQTGTQTTPTVAPPAGAVIDQMAAALGFTREGLLNILYQISLDPYIHFLRSCWGSNLAGTTSPSPPLSVFPTA